MVSSTRDSDEKKNFSLKKLPALKKKRIFFFALKEEKKHTHTHTGADTARR